MQNSAGMHRVRCATRTASGQLAAESALHLAPRLRDFGVRKRAKLTQHLRDLDAKRELFQNLTHCRLVQLQRRFFEYAQRSLAGCMQFLRARPAGIPEILEFRRASLAQNLRDIDAGRALFSH